MNVLVEKRILLIRGLKVILDSDLAKIYGVSTKRLNEQVKRNKNRFPEDFMFRLTRREQREVVANCDHLIGLKFSSHRALAFSEYGALMAANILNSRTAMKASVHVVRAFVKLRELMFIHKDLAYRLNQLEKKYDGKFKIVFEAIRQLMTPPPPEPEKPKRKIGFHAESAKH